MKWISVKTEIPPVRRIVLDRHLDHPVYLASFRPEGEWWDSQSGVRNPTHWLPIPPFVIPEATKEGGG